MQSQTFCLLEVETTQKQDFLFNVLRQLDTSTQSYTNYQSIYMPDKLNFAVVGFNQNSGPNRGVNTGKKHPKGLTCLVISYTITAAAEPR